MVIDLIERLRTAIVNHESLGMSLIRKLHIAEIWKILNKSYLVLV